MFAYGIAIPSFIIRFEVFEYSVSDSFIDRRDDLDSVLVVDFPAVVLSGVVGGWNDAL